MITQGDNGTIIRIRIIEEVNSYTSNLLILDSSIKDIIISIKTNTRSFSKYATIKENNICEITLNPNDLNESGIYKIQATVNYVDGNSYSSDISNIKVREKL